MQVICHGSWDGDSDNKRERERQRGLSHQQGDVDVWCLGLTHYFRHTKTDKGFFVPSIERFVRAHPSGACVLVDGSHASLLPKRDKRRSVYNYAAVVVVEMTETLVPPTQ